MEEAVCFKMRKHPKRKEDHDVIHFSPAINFSFLQRPRHGREMSPPLDPLRGPVGSRRTCPGQKEVLKAETGAVQRNWGGHSACSWK